MYAPYIVAMAKYLEKEVVYLPREAPSILCSSWLGWAPGLNLDAAPPSLPCPGLAPLPLLWDRLEVKHRNRKQNMAHILLSIITCIRIPSAVLVEDSSVSAVQTNT